MKNKATMALCAAALLAAAGAGLYLHSGTTAAEGIRKLAGLRMALELYRQEHKTFPSAYDRVLEAGNLEAVPELKLKWHLKTAKVRNVPSFRIDDTGGWAYIGNRSDPQFGLLYIDCSHKDEKARPWSEF